jgi:hypothetical protein
MPFMEMKMKVMVFKILNMIAMVTLPKPVSMA